MKEIKKLRPFKRIHLAMLIVMVLQCSVLYSQSPNVDSLEKILEKKITNTEKVEVLHELIDVFLKNDIEKSITYCNRLLKLSRKIDNKAGMSKAYYGLGVAYHQKNYKLDTIINAYQKSIFFAKQAENIALELKSLSGQARTYLKDGNGDKALELNQRVLKKAEEIGDKLIMIEALCDLGNIFRKEQHTQMLAKKYYFQALKYAEEVGEKDYVAANKSNIASIYYEEGNLDSALILAKDVLRHTETSGNVSSKSIILIGIGLIHDAKQEYIKAELYLDKAYKSAMEAEDFQNASIALFNLTSIYYKQKKYAKTIEVSKKALELEGESGTLYIRMSLHGTLSDCYQATKNYELALENYQIYHELSDSLNNLDKNKQIEEINIQYKVKEKEKENQLLKIKTENAKKTIKNQTIAAIALVLALLFAIGWGSFVYRANKQKKKINKILEAKVQERTSELQIANKNLEQANYELRTFNYIASHDIKEPIRVIGGYAGLIFKKLPNDLKENLGDYFDTIKRSTTQLYTLIEDFANYTTMSKNEKIETQDVDLNLLTNGVVEQLEETLKKYNGTVEIGDLPIIKTGSSLLFTTLKNIIENGLKYNKSETPTVKVDYNKTEAHHEIIVSDNGIGIDEQYHEKIFEMFKRLHNRGEYEGSGIGLAIVKLSVEKLGGAVHLQSEVGQGSRFVIELPNSI